MHCFAGQIILSENEVFLASMPRIHMIYAVVSIDNFHTLMAI